MNTHRLIIPLLAALTSGPQGASAQTTWGHEYRGELPVYADSIQQTLDYPLAWQNARTTFHRWQKRARAKVLECMGPPPPPPARWDMQVIAQERRQGYTAQLISLNLSRWYRVKAYLLTPDGPGPFPAVNLLHDHGAHLSIGKEKMVRPITTDSAILADADQWAAQLYDHQYLGDHLARNGYVVLATDAPLWGERGRAEGPDRKKYDQIAGNMMMMGQNLCAYMHYDDLRATDFLATLPQTDPRRIAAAGCSMGAYRAWMLAALSDKVSAACAVCWMVTTDEQLTTRHGRKENGGFANTIPGLRRWMDYPHIASIAAPKPMLLISGSQDHLFPLPGVRKAYDQMRQVWQSRRKGHLLVTHILDQPHECNRHDQQLIVDFLNQHLR